MSIAIVDGNAVPPELVVTHWDGWGKRWSDKRNSLPYRLEFSHQEAKAKLGLWWTDMIARESEGTADELDGIWLELQSANYPSFDRMLTEYSDLLVRFVRDDLANQNDFVGFLVTQANALLHGQGYFFLHSLTDLEIRKSSIILRGQCGRLGAQPRPNHSLERPR